MAVRHADDPEPLVAVGRWAGQILWQARGSRGFGYDPLMFLAQFDASVAELSDAQKNRHSHRAQASAALRALLAEVWQLGD